ncbi:hypothetical protein [Suttonella indologenes]|uniref:Uncharacterized protein n=1 Tax=Suttonella indologenes TaxID=13276 RepID=A0A380MJ53_9GAMM|nr:hypothetical protein [Suttonella indologenes]SUO90280.1 Uncharacterised protein [Suttonella indologenes]
MLKTTLLRQYDSQYLGRLFVMVCLIGFLLTSPDAYAQFALPAGDLKIPGVDTSDGNFLKAFATIISAIIVLMALAGVGIGMAETIFTMFSAANQARRDGEWGPTFKIIGIIIMVLVFALMLFYVINTFVLTPLSKIFA